MGKGAIPAKPEGNPMQTAFLDENNRARGFYELATRARNSSFPRRIYQVPMEALRLLDEHHIAYRRATDEEVRASHDQVRNPAPAVR